MPPGGSSRGKGEWSRGRGGKGGKSTWNSHQNRTWARDGDRGERPTNAQERNPTNQLPDRPRTEATSKEERLRAALQSSSLLQRKDTQELVPGVPDLSQATGNEERLQALKRQLQESEFVKKRAAQDSSSSRTLGGSAAAADAPASGDKAESGLGAKQALTPRSGSSEVLLDLTGDSLPSPSLPAAEPEVGAPDKMKMRAARFAKVGTPVPAAGATSSAASAPASVLRTASPVADEPAEGARVKGGGMPARAPVPVRPPPARPSVPAATEAAAPAPAGAEEPVVPAEGARVKAGAAPTRSVVPPGPLKPGAVKPPAAAPPKALRAPEAKAPPATSPTPSPPGSKLPATPRASVASPQQPLGDRSKEPLFARLVKQLPKERKRPRLTLGEVELWEAEMSFLTQWKAEHLKAAAVAPRKRPRLAAGEMKLFEDELLNLETWWKTTFSPAVKG